MKENEPKFHLASPVKDLKKTKLFYTSILGCDIGRQSKTWIDFNFFGHQLVTHLSPNDCKTTNINYVDYDKIPSRHFGVILPLNEWVLLKEKIELNSIHFHIKPKTRFKGAKGEQNIFFISDPNGNIIEMKSLKNESYLFDE
tara:strand:+ start:741 stop:1166 length:426 start_codon:yes stop_codon:yes gene_type:complete